jgi:hypothetical protein
MATLFIPAIDEYVQDTIGHWYRVVEVQASGYRFKVDQLYVTHNSETGDTCMRSYGYRPIVMGRSEFKFADQVGS